ncbi:MAG TPA: hypothetical protein VKU19_07470 [Bryobacteraceae bacterium]|nr:hypothetical protein [Bryobacteraceae bacterium]
MILEAAFHELLPARFYCYIKISHNEGGPDQIHIPRNFFGRNGALRTTQQMLLESRQFGFVNHHAQVVTFKIMIRDVPHFNP